MIRNIVHISNRGLKLLFNLTLMFLFLLTVAFSGFAWRLSQGPLSLSFAREYIQEALSDEAGDFFVRFDDIVMTWPEVRGPFMLDVTDLRVQKGRTEANAISINSASLGLSRRALFFGRIRPVIVMIESPSVELVRSADGKLDVFLRNTPDEDAPAPETAKDPQETGQDVAQLFKDMAARGPGSGSFLSRLNSFVINDASVAIRDHQFGLSWYLTDLDFRIEEHELGTEASLTVDLPGGREKNANIAIDMVYRRDSNDFRASSRLENINPYFISRFLPVPEALNGQDLFFSGKLDVGMDENLVVKDAKFSGTIPKGLVNVPSEFDEPIALENIEIESDYSAAEGIMRLSNLSGSIDGVPIKGTGNAVFDEKGFSIPVKMGVQAVDLSVVQKLFPKSEHDGNAYAWVGKRISGGSFSDVTLDMEVTGVRTRDEDLSRDIWNVDVPKMILDFTFEGAKVEYHDTLMPAENAKGRGRLDLGAEVLEIAGDSAKLGEMQGSDINVKVSGLMQDVGHLDVKAKVTGPMSTALEYISREPIGMGPEQIGLNYKDVKGTAVLDVGVSMPTIRDVPKDDVNVDVKGTMTDLMVPGVVEGLALSGGPLAVATEPGGFRVTGDAKLDGRDAQIEWHQNFESTGKPYSMQVKAKIAADQQLRNHFGVNLDEYINGTLPVDVVYTLKGGDSSVEVSGDLAPVRIYINALKYEKPVGVAGTMKAKATLKDNVLKQLSGVQASTKDLTVADGVINFAPMNGKKADIQSGKIPSLKIHGSSVAAEFEVANNVMNVKASGPVIDARPFLQNSKTPARQAAKSDKDASGGKVQPMKITVNAEKMLAQNEQVAGKPRLFLETDTDGDITGMQYDAVIGKSPLTVRFAPEASGKRTFLLETADAGAFLYAFGLYDNVHGGALQIYGEPQRGDLRGDLYGYMHMENFRVVKAPALASLLSLMSLTGVRDLLGNEGIVFSKLESDFEWQFREQGNMLVIKDGKTSGSSIGLTFGGTVNRGTQRTDISGTIIPMTEINSMLSKIPLLGNLLGGETGLIAATYTMKGPTSDPTVMVNPLSVLAPGFLRNILFEGGFKNTVPRAEPKKEEPKPAPPSTSSALPSSNSLAKQGVNH